MKKKTIIKPAATGFVVGIIIALALIITGCGGNNISKSYKIMQDSMNKVVSSTMDLKVYDKDVEISGYTMTCEIKDGKLVVGRARTTLNANYELETELPTFTTYDEFKREDLLYVDLSENLVSSYNNKKNVTTCVVKEENIAKVISVVSVDAKGDATVEFTIENDKVIDISVKYDETILKRLVVKITV